VYFKGYFGWKEERVSRKASCPSGAWMAEASAETHGDRSTATHYYPTYMKSTLSIPNAYRCTAELRHFPNFNIINPNISYVRAED
jgi:hypothetical protein